MAEGRLKIEIKLGSYLLVPAVNGRKQKKRTGYAKVLDLVKKQSGEVEILVQQGNKRLLFTLDELERFWSRCSELQPRVMHEDKT